MEQTTDTALQQKLARLPVNARVALALACAKRTLDAFAERFDVLMEVYNRCKAALDDGWAWETTRGVDAPTLYEHIHPLLACEHRYGLAQEPRVLAALFAVVSALYFTTWQAEGYDFLQSRIPPPSLPNDIAEVTDDTVSECMAYAVQATAHQEEEQRWQQAALARLLSDYETDDPEGWGKAVEAAYFERI